jgi:hypothetical protein
MDNLRGRCNPNGKDKGKETVESINQGLVKANCWPKGRFNSMKFTSTGNSDQSAFASTEHAEESRKNLEALRKRCGLPTSASQVQSSDIQHDQPGPSDTSNDELNAACKDLASIVKQGKALKELLMKAPDDLTAYDSQTQTLMQNIGEKFPVAADIIQRHPSAMQLVDQAAKAGATFGGYAEDSPDKCSWPYCCIETKRVFIPKTCTDHPIEAVSNFLFELTNAINSPRFQAVIKQARKNTITKQDFVREFLETESEAGLKISEIWSQIKEASENPRKLDAYDSLFWLQEYQADPQKGKEDLIHSMRTDKIQGRYTHQERYEQVYEQIRRYVAIDCRMATAGIVLVASSLALMAYKLFDTAGQPF